MQFKYLEWVNFLNHIHSLSIQLKNVICFKHLFCLFIIYYKEIILHSQQQGSKNFLFSENLNKRYCILILSVTVTETTLLDETISITILTNVHHRKRFFQGQVWYMCLLSILLNVSLREEEPGLSSHKFRTNSICLQFLVRLGCNFCYLYFYKWKCETL